MRMWRRKERDVSNVCACGCGAAIPSVRCDGKPQRYKYGHGGGLTKLQRDHRRIVARIRSIPPRPTLYSDDG